MKINNHNQAMKWIGRKPSPYTKDERKQIVKDLYEPKSKPMNLLKYMDTISNLYSDAPPPKSDAHYDAVTAKAKQEYALKKKLENTSGYVDQFGNRESPTDRIQALDRIKEVKKRKVIPIEDELVQQSLIAKKPLPKPLMPEWDWRLSDWRDLFDEDAPPPAPEDIEKVLNIKRKEVAGLEAIMNLYKKRA